MQGCGDPGPSPGFLQFTCVGPVYLVGDEVYVAPGGTREEDVVRIGSLKAHAGALNAQLRCAQASDRGLLGQARAWIQQLPLVRFCMLDLIPYLQTLQDPSTFPPARPLDVQRVLDGVERCAAELKRRLRRSRPKAIAASEIAKLFGTPCAILGERVSPLEPAGTTAPAESDVVVVAGARYRVCLGQARPLNEILSELDRMVLLPLRQQDPPDGPQTVAATELVGKIEKLLDRYGGVDRGRYRVVYTDRYHQVHYSRGRFLLVRGPVPKRNGRGNTWVAIELRGGARRQTLTSAPQAAANPEMFWRADGTPTGWGMCMGQRGQYSHLLSEELTDAEAVVLWLDAGVVLATHRSAFHQAWRIRMAEGDRQAGLSRLLTRIRRARL